MKRTILWAEDQHELFVHYVNVLTRYLVQYGMEVDITRAVDGDAAYAALRMKQQTYDLVVMDLEMPRGEGIQTIRGVMREAPGTRIMVVSSHVGDPVYEEPLKPLLEQRRLMGWYLPQDEEKWTEAIRHCLETESLRLLHVADLRLGRADDGRGAWRREEAVEEYLLGIAERRKPNYVVVSGGVASRGSYEEFRRARAFFERLTAGSALKPGRLLFTPGPGDTMSTGTARDWQNYAQFLQDVGGRDLVVAMPVLNRLVTEGGDQYDPSCFFTVNASDNLRTVMVGLNLPGSFGDGKSERLVEEQLGEINRWLRPLRLRYQSYLKVAVLSQPLLAPVPGGTGLPPAMGDVLVQLLITNGFQLVLHGGAASPLAYLFQPLLMKGPAEHGSLLVCGAGRDRADNAEPPIHANLILGHFDGWDELQQLTVQSFRWHDHDETVVEKPVQVGRRAGVVTLLPLPQG